LVEPLPEQGGEMIKIDLLPGSPENPRNSEGSMIELRNRKIMFAYTHFYGGKSDASSAYIGARYSEDRGRTWSGKDRVVVENEGKQNVMSVSLLRIESGEILLGYLVKNSRQDCRYFIKKSTDECESFSEKILVTELDSGIGNYFVVNNDRIVQLKNGRIIVPACLHPSTETEWRPGRAMIFYSDDHGNTWKHSKTILDSPDGSDKHGLQEPGVIELKDGRLLMWTRTNLGSQFYSYSEDGGETWSNVQPSSLISPLSPASIKRIPETGDLLVVYNDRSGRFPLSDNPYSNRTPLVAAISKDEGTTWEKHFLIEDDPEGRFCYTSILFLEDKIILSYSAAKAKDAWGLLRVCIIGINEIYG